MTKEEERIEREIIRLRIDNASLNRFLVKQEQIYYDQLNEINNLKEEIKELRLKLNEKE